MHKAVYLCAIWQGNGISQSCREIAVKLSRRRQRRIGGSGESMDRFPFLAKEEEELVLTRFKHRAALANIRIGKRAADAVTVIVITKQRFDNRKSIFCVKHV